MNEKELDLLKELEESIWELKLWVREGEDARNIIVKILSEISDIIEKYRREIEDGVKED